ncbi:MAG: hypothetical protein WD645_01495 [Dehalococcoidia bacterium]
MLSASLTTLEYKMNNLMRVLMVSTVAVLGISPAAAQGLGGGASAKADAGGGGASTGLDTAAEASGGAFEQRGSSGGASVGLETAAGASGGASERRGDNGNAPLQTPASSGGGKKYGTSTEVLTNLQTRVGTQAGQVIGLILESRWSENSLQDVEVEELQLHNASALVGAEAQADFETVLSARARAIAQLRKAVSNNAAITAWLQARGVAPEAVVAVGKTANGSLAVFSR